MTYGELRKLNELHFENERIYQSLSFMRIPSGADEHGAKDEKGIIKS